MGRAQKDYRLEDVKIEKGVPRLPINYQRGGRVNKWFMHLIKMKVDDSFAIPYTDDKDQNRVHSAITGAIRNFKKKYEPDWTFTKRSIINKKEVRVWRDK